MVDLDNLERLHAAATPGPWKADNWSRVWHEPKQGVRRTVADCVRVTVKSPKRHRANARLIAAMHEALPELIAENRKLRERVRELEIREVDYIEERDALLSTKYALERQAKWLAEVAAMTGVCVLAKGIKCEHQKNNLCGLDYYDMRDCILKVAKEGR